MTISARIDSFGARYAHKPLAHLVVVAFFLVVNAVGYRFGGGSTSSRVGAADSQP